jgi:hypothetical protein
MIGAAFCRSSERVRVNAHRIGVRRIQLDCIARRPVARCSRGLLKGKVVSATLDLDQ